MHTSADSHPSDAPPGSPLWNAAGLVVILLAVIFCAWPGMGSRVFSDDLPQIARSSSFTHWTQVFQLDAFYFFRPVKNAVFMLAAPYENRLIVWHSIGLAAYLAATLGVYRIVSICAGPGRVALLATAMWALSPTCVSTAIWLSCANISLGVVAAAATFAFHEKAARSHPYFNFALALLCFAAALFCYEALIAVPGLLFVRDFFQRRLAFNRRSVAHYALYTLLAAAFLVVRYQMSAKNIGINDHHAAFAPGTQAIHLTLSAPWFLWRHFLMWVFPFGHIELLGSYEWMRSASVTSIVLAWGFLIALLAVSALTWKRLPMVSYGLLFFVVASIPSGNFLPGYNGPINDAYVTIPSIGLALAIASVCGKLIDELRKRRREADSGVPALAAIIIVLLAYRVPLSAAYFHYWSGVWRNPIQLVLLMSDTRPHQFHSKGYCSSLLFTAGYVDQAETLAGEVLREAPFSEWSQLTMARIAGLRDDPAKQEKLYRELIGKPMTPDMIKGMANIELATAISKDPKRLEEAADLCRTCLKSRHSSPRNHIRAVLALADIYKAQGNLEKARVTLQKGIAIHKTDSLLPGALAALANIPAPTPH